MLFFLEAEKENFNFLCQERVGGDVLKDDLVTRIGKGCNDSAGFLDIRPIADFTMLHFPCSVSIPNLTQDRLVELPTRFRKFGLVLPATPTRDSLSSLECLNIHRHFPNPVIKVPNLGSPEWSSFWAQIPPQMKEQGTSSHILFSPSPCLGCNIAKIEAGLADSYPGEANWTAIDLGCGAGRDAFYLLSRRGHMPERPVWHVTGVDRLPRALQRASDLIMHNSLQASGFQLDDSCRLHDRWDPVHAELKKDGGIKHRCSMARNTPFWEQSYHLVTASRFLPPRAFWPILEKMVRKGGGYFAISAFVEGTYHPVHPDHVLFKGELRRFFEPRGWTIDLEEEETTEEGKRIVLFLARRN